MANRYKNKVAAMIESQAEADAFKYGCNHEVALRIHKARHDHPTHKFIAAITSDDPFDVLNVLNSINEHVVNPFTNTPVTNLDEAITLAEMQCDNLRQLDIVERDRLRKLKNAQNQQRFRDNAKQALAAVNPELAELQAKLADARAKRKDLIAQWDNYIFGLKRLINGHFGKLGDTSSDLYK